MKKQAKSASKPAKKCDCKCNCDEKKARPPIFGSAKWLMERFKDKATEIPNGSKDFKSFREYVESCGNIHAPMTLMHLYKIENEAIKSGRSKPYFIATIYGGLNGCGKWADYCNALSALFSEGGYAKYDPKKCEGMNYHNWMIELKNDCLDDVWTAVIGVRPYIVKLGCQCK